jgi:hypothetical protein
VVQTVPGSRAGKNGKIRTFPYHEGSPSGKGVGLLLEKPSWQAGKGLFFDSPPIFQIFILLRAPSPGDVLVFCTLAFPGGKTGRGPFPSWCPGRFPPPVEEGPTRHKREVHQLTRLQEQRATLGPGWGAPPVGEPAASGPQLGSKASSWAHHSGPGVGIPALSSRFLLPAQPGEKSNFHFALAASDSRQGAVQGGTLLEQRGGTGGGPGGWSVLAAS